MIEKYSWKQVAYNSNVPVLRPCPRWGHTTCTIGLQVILFGGYAQSIYMNDLWSFNTQTMQWSEVKTNGPIPSPRSNCSISYDSHNNRIVFFGGGGSNKTRYNSINILDWETKTWSEIKYSQNQQIPWERTYHAAELLYPYLVVYGGQGLADLDDLWVFNFETSRWKEIKFEKQNTRPCGRRFHSSCLIGNEFYVIAGCHTRYRCLNDIYSIDLTELIKQGSTQNLCWKQKNTKGTALLSRWGHSSSSHNNKIYIFGGRFSTDLNDLLIFDPIKETLKSLKVSSDSLPKPRRRPSTCFIGNCLLMFGGFNSEYYNDLYYINTSQNFIKQQYISNDEEQEKTKYIRQLLDLNGNNKFDHLIKSSQGRDIPCIKHLVKPVFDDEEIFEEFLTGINGKITEDQLKEILEIIYLGYGKSEILEKYEVDLPTTEEEKRKVNCRKIEDKLQLSNPSSLSAIIRNKSAPTVVELSDQKFWQLIQKNRQTLTKNVSLVINNQFVIESNVHLLSMNCRYFRTLFSHFHEGSSLNQQGIIKLTLPSQNIVLFEIMINFIIHGVVAVLQGMSYENWSELYVFADYFCLSQLKQICIYQLYHNLSERTVEKILSFSQKQGIDKLSFACCKYKLRNMAVQQEQLKERQMRIVYEMNKFQILQKQIMQESKLIKTKSAITTNSQGQKENYQVCN